MTGVYKYTLVCRTAAYNIIIYFRSRYSVVKQYTVPQKKRDWKKRYTIKKKGQALREWNLWPHTLEEESKLPSCHPLPYKTTCQNYMYLNVRTPKLDILSKNEKSTHRRETTRARPRPPPAESGETSKVRHIKQTSHRMNSGPCLELGRLRLQT